MARLLLCVVLAAGLAGCASSGSNDPLPEDAITAFQNPTLPVSVRTRAMDEAWEDMQRGRTPRGATREGLKSLAWSRSTPPQLRLHALELLFSEETPEALSDLETMATLMLPPERNVAVVQLLCREIVEHGWTDATPALIRAYSRPINDMDEPDRPERIALELLYPSLSPEEVAFEIFLNPPESVLDGEDLDIQARTRHDAWDLLARIDEEGAVRLTLLREEAPAATEDPVVANLQACLRDFHTLPLTGDELQWLDSLRNSRNSTNAAWWSESREAIRRLDGEQRRGIRMRHIEPIRFAARHRVTWLATSREELLEELRFRLEDRRTHRRPLGAGENRIPERLANWEDRLVWADLVTLLLIDDTLQRPEVTNRLIGQARLDRADRTTEFGGMIDVNPVAQDEYRVVLFPATPATRIGDRRFVASADMIRSSDRAIAHYHLHAQTPGNSRFAGPSSGDIEYAQRFGRTCVVLTNISDPTLGVDVYFPNRITIDLGELHEVIHRGTTTAASAEEPAQ